MNDLSAAQFDDDDDDDDVVSHKVGGTATSNDTCAVIIHKSPHMQ